MMSETTKEGNGKNEFYDQHSNDIRQAHKVP
jgi:hypothetical protein